MNEKNEKFKTKLQKLLSQSINEIVSINDIQDKYFGMEELTEDELKALRNFEKYRMKKLTGAKDQQKFDRNFTRIQVLSNLAHYTEFLKERYRL